MSLDVQVQIRQRELNLINRFFIKKTLIKTRKIIRTKLILQIKLSLPDKLPLKQTRFKKIEA